MAKMWKCQEKAIIKWVAVSRGREYTTVDDIPADVYNAIYNMHPHEDFDSNVNRVLIDHYFEVNR